MLLANASGGFSAAAHAPMTTILVECATAMCWYDQQLQQNSAGDASMLLVLICPRLASGLIELQATS